MTKLILPFICFGILLCLPSFTIIGEPTKKETFDFIINQGAYFSKDNLQKYATSIDAYNYENLTLDLTATYPEWTVNSRINLNDIKDVYWSGENRTAFDDQQDALAKANGFPTRTSDITVYFRVPFQSKTSYTKQDYTKTQTEKDIKFSFDSKIEAKKMYKALVHMQKIVGVKNDLFDDK